MARDRDWVDYTNLAANVVQTAQLGSLNSKMRQLAELESLKEYREQQEAAVAKHEDLLRDAVFFYTEQLRDVEEIANQNPVVAYIRASHLKVTYERMPQFKASGFRRFEDKERLANVQRTCDRLIRGSAARLKPEELETAGTCIAHLFDRKELVKMIEVQEEREQLEQQKRHVAKQAAPLLRELNEISLESRLVEQEQPQPPDRSGVRRAASVLAARITSLFAFEERKRKREALKRRAAEIERQLAIMNREIDRAQSYVNQNTSLYAKFGEATSGGYRNMLAERDELLVRMMGDFAKGFIKRGQPPVATSVLGAEDQKIKDAALALMALGFKQVEAHDAVRKVQSMLGPHATVEDLVRACLTKQR